MKNYVFVNGDVVGVEELLNVLMNDNIMSILIECSMIKLICVEMNVSFIEENIDSYEYIGSGNDFIDDEVDFDEFSERKFWLVSFSFFFSDKCEDLVVSR